MRIPHFRAGAGRAVDVDPLEAWFETRIASAFRADLAPVASMRHTVLAAYRDAVADSRINGQGGLRADRRPRRQWAVAGALALSLIVGSVGFVAASDGPGQPLYGLRLTIELLTLPPPGSPDRPRARLRMLDSRLAEAQQAGARGDLRAADAALVAADAQLADILADAPDDDAVPGDLDLGLDRAATVLSGLASDLPASAAPGVSRTLDHVNRARHDRSARRDAAAGSANPTPAAGDGAAPGGRKTGPHASSPAAGGRKAGGTEQRASTGGIPAPRDSAGKARRHREPATDTVIRPGRPSSGRGGLPGRRPTR